MSMTMNRNGRKRFYILCLLNFFIAFDKDRTTI